jgi:hypothetical protein
MATVGFRLATPARGSGGKIPYTFERALASGYAEAQGALVLIDGTNKIAACGADPTSVAGVALTPGGTDTSGFNILGHKEFPAGYMQVIACGDEHFLAPYVGTLPTNPGGQYGVVRDSDGVWKVDFAETTTKVVTYVGIPTFSPGDASGAGQNGEVEVMFIGTVVQPS